MYGTRKQLTRRLKCAFDANEPLALLVWTTDCVTALCGSLNITEQEAALLLSHIGSLPMSDHQAYGVSFSSASQLLSKIRSKPRPVTVSADTLARLSETAETSLKIISDMEGDGGLPESTLVREGRALVAEMRSLLAA
ncbi:MAG TPA: DUF1380 family protein [Scandinavium sp.]|jgi:hypothetical protein